MKTIAIVGFGFCGRLAFFHLAKNSTAKTKILIFEKNGVATLGTAFSRFSPHYILNVPVNKMSAFSDRPAHFCEFLQKKYPQILEEIGENGFAPRQIYGEYLDEITQEAFALAKKSGVEFEFIAEEVTSVKPDKSTVKAESAGKFFIETKSGAQFCADEILLAVSFRQSDLPFNVDAKNIVKHLWTDVALTQFHQKNFTNETICLIGSGLTAVDVIVGLHKKNFHGKIFVISRRGNFPKKHFAQAQKNPDFISPDDAKKGLIFLCLKIRKFLRENPQFNLRHVVASIRPFTVKLWQNFDEKNKKLFLRISPYWNIFRHLAPIPSIDLIQRCVDLGQIEIKKKGVKKIITNGAKILVQTRDEELQCDYLVNCLGFQFDAKKYPLLAQMLEADLLKKDLLLAASNHPKIHLLGGLNIGRDFECTAVPDLRVNVEAECL